MADKDPAASAAAARAEVFEALRKEMELADYATAESGQKVRRVPRNQKPERRAKREALLQADLAEMAIEAEDDCEKEEDGGKPKKRRKRLRGSKVALDDVVLKSMPLANPTSIRRNESTTSDSGGKDDAILNENKEDQEADDGNNERQEMLKEVAALGIDLNPDEVDKMDDYQEEDEGDDLEGDKIECDDENDGGEGGGETIETTETKKSSVQIGRKDEPIKKVFKTGLIKPTKRTMHRLRDFTSQRLAQKHGEAIGAHIRGMSETAVQKLREVAKLAPGAPQVYSSLGMVFESMLASLEGGDTPENDRDADDVHFDHHQRRLELAEKTYSSYHVAAVLCKRDFVLWERSGDAAIKVEQIYSEIITHVGNHPVPGKTADAEDAMAGRSTTCKGFDPNAGPKKWRADRKGWLEHALSAYQASDKLRPPGIEIPCKLAQLHISLGHYMEALSILTDLRNIAGGRGSGRELGSSGMEGSYPCWLLYADLMTKIGFECKQWNEGSSTAENYMFKRWLRKNSKSFDWKERRLQALCLALEAAAGSSSCTKLIQWTRERYEKVVEENEGDLDAPENDTADNTENDTSDVDKNASDRLEATDKAKDTPQAAELKYKKERENLLNINKTELLRFDQMTKEMNLVAESLVFKNRVEARQALVEKHRAAVKALAMRKYAEEHPGTPTEAERDIADKLASSESEAASNTLPLQGSFNTVHDIAAVLLRQCITLGLFQGGLLAVQSVANYSKERVSRQEARNKKLAEKRERDNIDHGMLVQRGFTYDKINFESDSSDEEGIGAFISDDEDLEDSGFLTTLKSGRLPDDIRSMHAICLLGAGGHDFVALNYLDKVMMSDELDLFGNDVKVDGISDDPRWLSFSQSFNSPITKSYILASLADLVKDREKVNQGRYLDIYRKHFFKLIDNNQGLDLDQALSSSNDLHRGQAMKILIAAMTLLIECSRVTLNEASEKRPGAAENVVTDTTYTLKIMTRFQYILWNPSYSDWSLPQSSIDMVSILSKAIDNLVEAASLVENKSLLDGVMKSRHLISIFSKVCQGDNSLTDPPATSSLEMWRTFPLPCSWQTSFHEKISLRAYNLCVGCCVSSFSGWTPAEFNLDELCDANDVTFFGATLERSSVAGFLPADVASSIADQWDYVCNVLPDVDVLPYETHLDERKKSIWYQKVMNIIEKQKIDSGTISLYGEQDGIRALLSFSMLCLIAAEGSEGVERDDFVKLSMSVLLPVTQFSIDKHIWHSTLGTAAINGKSKVGYWVDENCQWLGPRKSKQGRIQYNNKAQRIPRQARSGRPIRKEIRSVNIVKVPASALLEEWNVDSEPLDRMSPSKDAELSMKKVDDAMKNLRKSRTISSLEQASIDVSVSLLNLAAHDECNNPFVCLTQAAMFAAMGSKRGNNDEPFKRFLPLKNLCSPLEALNILGRADCLRAIHFLDEAQYLCTWVASVCRLHRDPKNEDAKWSLRWKVIGIIGYVVSSAINETGEVLSRDEITASSLKKWDDETKEEFSNGQSDALILVTMDPSKTANAESLPPDGEAHRDESHVPDQGLPNNVQEVAESNAEPFLHEELKVPDIGSSSESVEERSNENPYANVQIVGI